MMNKYTAIGLTTLIFVLGILIANDYWSYNPLNMSHSLIQIGSAFFLLILALLILLNFYDAIKKKKLLMWRFILTTLIFSYLLGVSVSELNRGIFSLFHKNTVEIKDTYIKNNTICGKTKNNNYFVVEFLPENSEHQYKAIVFCPSFLYTTEQVVLIEHMSSKYSPAIPEKLSTHLLAKNETRQ